MSSHQDRNYSGTSEGIAEQHEPLALEAVPSLIKSTSLNDAQKEAILIKCGHHTLLRFYDQAMASLAGLLPLKSGDLNEANYRPLVSESEVPPALNAPLPLYPPYTGYFQSSQDAKTYRKRIRVAPKANAPDVERVKRYGRQYWVPRIYEAMIDITAVMDRDTSIHRRRFTASADFDPTDLEAAAHHVFDAALAVHERGFNRPQIYHKKVVRGKLMDVSEKSLERRLARICLCLKHVKATVDDAVRGGVTLALLCDNPEARGFTKWSNNVGNKKRGERLRLAKEATKKAAAKKAATKKAATKKAKQQAEQQRVVHDDEKEDEDEEDEDEEDDDDEDVNGDDEEDVDEEDDEEDENEDEV